MEKKSAKKIKVLLEPQEEWRAVESVVEGDYDVSNMGNVRAINYRKQVGVMHTIKKRYTPAGNAAVRLAGKKIYIIARLVLEAFVGPAPSANHFAFHKNGNSGDDRLENLEWKTREEINKLCIQKAIAKGTFKSVFVQGHKVNVKAK